MNVCKAYLLISHLIALVLLPLTNAKSRPHNDHSCRVYVNGVIEGRSRRYVNDNSTRYCAYLGMPYAHPPVGKLRFQSPMPIYANHTILRIPQGQIKSHKTLGNVCMQNDNTGVNIGNEDCLYLNVYTPMPSKTSFKARPKYPVMLWIYEGAFSSGSGNLKTYGPDYLVKEDVILVTFNYRLGVFGFLSAPEWGIWGNMGLKDQRQALRWIHDNIEKFGGDKNRVTIFGISAGAACVHYILFDKSSNGLYHRAILQSGSALNIWATQFQPKQRFAKLKSILNITSLEDLQYEDARKLSQAGLVQVPDDEDRRRAAELVFNPIVESSQSPDPIVTTSILDKMQNGEFDWPEVNIMMGFTSAEGHIMLPAAAEDKELIKTVLNDVESLIPRDAFIWVDPNGDEQQTIIKKLRDFYIDIKNKTDDTDAYVKLNGDCFFLHGIHRTLKAIFSKNSTKKPKIFLYKLSDDTYSAFKTHVLAKLDPAWKDLPGSSHGDELGYLLTQDYSSLITSNKPVYVEISNNAEQSQRRIVAIWTNFAKSGDPLYDVTDLSGVLWEPYSKDNRKYLDMAKSGFKMNKFEEADRMKIWDEVYEVGLKNCKNTTICTLE